MIGIRLVILPIIGMAVQCVATEAVKCDSSHCGPNSYCDKQLDGLRCVCNEGFCANVTSGCIASPECTQRSKGLPYTPDDEDATLGEFPWHVGIFYKSNGEFMQICVGSIIRKRLILTAAHCFVNSVNPADYKVAAGKYHRSWNITNEMEQRFDVESVVIKDSFNGVERLYADDIALLILKDEVAVTESVHPIDVDLDSQYVNAHLSDGVYGYVAGWGNFPNGTEKSLLGKRKLPFVGFRQCYEDFPKSFRPYFTSDKFCAGYVAESKVCYRDSGAALAFKQEVTDVKRQWFVQGIVSLGVPPKSEGLCTNQRELFTKVSSHMDWLKTYYYKY